MNSDITLGGSMAGAVPASADDSRFVAPPQAVPGISDYPVQFTGSGSEYFRIWIVNLLLLIVTLGIYTPWAKVRKLKYFYANTHVGGHALDFHGEPRRMLRGYMLVGVLLGLINFAGEINQAAGSIGLIAVALIWPALVRASLQFRLANTSWRGLRLRFTGTMRGAYKAFWVPIAFMALFGAALGYAGLSAEGEGNKPDKMVGLLFMALMLAFYAAAPYFWYLLKRYQHDHYAFAQLQTELRTTAWPFYKLFIKAAGLGVLILFGMVVFAALIGVGLGGSLSWGAMLSLVPVFVLGYILMFVVPVPYFVSRLQNLLWSRTGNSQIRFKSDLRFKPLLWLTLKNWFLTLVTLGFYWPFAAVATARMKLEAISVHARVDLDTLADRSRAGNQDAAGDAAGDLMGIDFGL